MQTNTKNSFSILTNWFTFSLVYMPHNYQNHLPLKEIFKSLVSKEHHMEKKLLFIGYKNVEWSIKGVVLNKFSLVKVKSLLIEFYLNIYTKNLKVSCSSSINNCSIFIVTLSNWSLKIGDWKLRNWLVYVISCQSWSVLILS